MKIVVDTGVFSASLDPKRRPDLAAHVRRLGGNQVFLAAATVAELRFGALVAGWGAPRQQRLEDRIAATTLVPVTDALLTRVAELRLACRNAGHPLADRVHTNDLWIAASAVHIDAPIVSADNVYKKVVGLTVLE